MLGRAANGTLDGSDVGLTLDTPTGTGGGAGGSSANSSTAAAAGGTANGTGGAVSEPFANERLPFGHLEAIRFEADYLFDEVGQGRGGGGASQGVPAWRPLCLPMPVRHARANSAPELPLT